jgi:hypothetical protein
MDREESIACVLEAFKSGEFKSLRAAAKNWNIPPTTLFDKLHGPKSYHDAHVEEQACNPGEEKALIQWIQDWAAQGFPIRFDMVKAMAEHLILQRNSSGQRETISFKPLSHNWPARFVAQHRHLKSHIVRPLEVPQNLAYTHENFKKWFEVFRAAMDKYQVDYHNVYNIDETGFRLGATDRMYVIIDKRLGVANYTGEATKGKSLTVIECTCADRSTIPLFIIYKGENIQGTWIAEAALNSWMVTTSPKGWTNNVSGITWLRRQFNPSTWDKCRGGVLHSNLGWSWKSFNSGIH